MVRKVLGFALLYSLGIGTAAVAVALVLAAHPAVAVGDVQHAVLITDTGTTVTAVGSCPYLAERAVANACPYLAQRSAAGACPYLSERVGSDCPALGGGNGSSCPRSGGSAETPPPSNRTGRGVLLALLGAEPAPAAPVDPA